VRRADHFETRCALLNDREDAALLNDREDAALLNDRERAARSSVIG
jgi:hypothetical protein